MEKKISVEVNGRTVRIMPHMLPDLEKLGAVQTKKVLKETPKELLKPIQVIKASKPVELTPKATEVINPLPAMEVKSDAVPEIFEVKKRKTPVRSKTK